MKGIVLASLGFPLQRCCIKCCPNPTRMVNICMIVVGVGVVGDRLDSVIRYNSVTLPPDR